MSERAAFKRMTAKGYRNFIRTALRESKHLIAAMKLSLKPDQFLIFEVGLMLDKEMTIKLHENIKKHLPDGVRFMLLTAPTQVSVASYDPNITSIHGRVTLRLKTGITDRIDWQPTTGPTAWICCAWCQQHFANDDLPLIMTRSDGLIALFCDGCIKMCFDICGKDPWS